MPVIDYSFLQETIYLQDLHDLVLKQQSFSMYVDEDERLLWRELDL